MKKKNLTHLFINKKTISSLQHLKGGAQDTTSNTGTYLTANLKDCPDNTLALGCGSLGACDDTFWC